MKSRYVWFFAKRKRLKAALNVAAPLLEIQMALCAFEEQFPTLAQVRKNLFVVGYLYGFCDSVLQACKIEDDDEYRHAMAQILGKLLGVSEGVELVLYMMETQSHWGEDEVLVNALMQSGQEVSNWAKTKGESKCLGLVRHVNGISK